MKLDRFKCFIQNRFTVLFYAGKQMHPNSTVKHLFKLFKKRSQLNKVTKQKMDTGLSKHVQGKNKQNGCKA